MDASPSVSTRLCFRIALFGVVMFCASARSSAQRYFFELVGGAEKVYTAIQAPDGMVWIGTSDAIASYDGHTITEMDLTQGVAPGGVLSLVFDEAGRLWAGHLGGGLSIRQGRHWAKADPDGPRITSDIVALAQGDRGSVWVGTFGQGLLRIEVDADGRTAIREQLGEAQGASDRITGLCRLASGDMLVVTGQGQVLRMAADGSLQGEFVVPGLTGEHRVTTVFQARDGSIWLGTRFGGAFRQEPATGKVEVFDLHKGMPISAITCFGEDEKGQVWVGTFDAGIARVERNGLRRFTNANGLPGTKVRSIVPDREGNMLIAVGDAGLCIHKGDRFLNFGTEDGLLDAKVWAVLEDRDGRMWIGTNGGVAIFDPRETSTGRMKTLSMQQGKLTSNLVRSLRQDQRGTIWIGTETGGLLELDPLSFRANAHEELSPYIPELKVTALEVGLPGEVWVGTLRGLVRVLPGSGSVPNVYMKADGLAGDNVSTLFRDAQGTLWVGAVSSGIARIDNGIARRIPIDEPFTPTCFTQDASGRIWVGTESIGLLVLDNDVVVARYGTTDGLLSNGIRSLVMDGKGTLWVGTTKGLSQWVPGGDGFISYTRRAGFIGGEAKQGATCRTLAGDVWVGTAQGATRVVADQASATLPPPAMALRGVKVNLEDREADDGLDLAHGENSLRITYGSVSLSDPGAVRYQYRMVGLEDDWQPVTEETTANYPSLPPGRYVFEARAINRSGQWSPPLSMAVVIHPPWYRSWWFYTAMVLFVASVIFSWVKVRERQLRMRNMVLERKVEERTAEVVAQSREIAGQKVRIEELLLNILPKEVSDELTEKGKATAKRHQAVTVLFTDMKGFTKVAERMSPEQLVDELDQCFIQFDTIIDRYGIEKIKTIGDSYMCAAGVPIADPWHAHRIVLAALEVRDMMRRWRDDRKASGGEPWELRIGVHSGPVVAGVVGRRKFAYDIWGDTVNTASRMESAGEQGEVNISGDTYQLVKDHFECIYRGKLEAKNKGPVDMYFVRRIAPTHSADAEGSVASAAFLRQLGVAQPQEQLA